MLGPFYEAVLPRSGHYALFLGRGKQHLWAESTEELVALTRERADETDVYFATASFRTTVNRKAENVHKLRAFRFDIDAGEIKYAKYGDAVYATQEDAIRGLIAFSHAAGFAPSYVVSSGAGLHVYYCLDEDLEPAEWTPTAQRLQERALELGLRVDAKVTADAARVLRPPGSLHASGQPVVVLRDTGVLFSHRSLRTRLGASPAPKYDLSVNAEAKAEVIGPPKDLNKILPECAALRHARENPQIAEPFWRAMLGVVKHTLNGDELAHQMSEGYSGYDYEETQKKLDNWKTGPATCTEFAHHFAGCQACPHWGKIKSPIVLGALSTPEIRALPEEQQPVVAAPAQEPGHVWDGSIVSPFFVKAGMLYQRRVVSTTTPGGDDSELITDVPVTDTPFWFGNWSAAADTLDTSVINLHAWIGNEERIYTLKQELIGAPKELHKWLAGKAIHLIDSKLQTKNAMDDHIRAQLARIKTMHLRPKINDRFGLRFENDGQLAYAHGKYLIRSDGYIVEAMLGEKLSRSTERWAEKFCISPLVGSDRWEPNVWPSVRSAAFRYVEFVRKFYDHPDLAPYQLAIMFMLASPLMPFVGGQFRMSSTLPPNGLSVSLYSHKSGRGKTAACKVGMAAFGNPEQLVRPRDESSTTEAARRMVLSAHGTLPVVMDEMGNTANAQMIANVISAVANGAAKERADAKYGTETPWALVNVITCNHSQRELINQAQAESAAIQLRLLELDVNYMGNRTPEMQQAYDDEWPRMVEQCSGALGALLALLYCRQGAQALNDRVTRCIRVAKEAIGSAQEARFQWRAFGAVLALQEILEACGLAMFDTATLTKTFADAYFAGSQFIEDSTLPSHGVDLIGRALNDMKPLTLVTDTESHRGHNPHVRDLVLNLGGAPKTVVARHVQRTGVTYLSVEALREWCGRKRVPFAELVKDCQKSDVMLRMGKTSWRGQFDLFKGTAEDGTSASTAVFKINVNRLKYDEVNYDENVVSIHQAKAETKPLGPQPYEEGNAS